MSVKLLSEGFPVNEEKNWRDDWEDLSRRHEGDERQLEFNFDNNELEFCFCFDE